MFISQKVDHSLSYRHFDRERVPFAGGAAQITSKEYGNVTRRIAVAGYGMFDIENPEQQHFGRTLADLLNRAQLEQYVINVMQPYHEWVGEGSDKRLVMRLWVMWYEQIDVSRSAADAYARTLELPEEEIRIKSSASIDTFGRISDTLGGEFASSFADPSGGTIGGGTDSRRGSKRRNKPVTSRIRQVSSGISGNRGGDSGPQ